MKKRGRDLGGRGVKKKEARRGGDDSLIKFLDLLRENKTYKDLVNLACGM